VRFVEARANGTQTVYSLTTLFSGTYFSQQSWSKGAPDPVSRADTQLFPHEDPTVRFPQILADAGVPTVHVSSTTWIVNAVGVMRGFSEEIPIRNPKFRYSLAADVANSTIKRLRRHGDGPLF